MNHITSRSTASPHPAALIAATIGSLLTMAIHPTSLQPLAPTEVLLHQNHVLVAVHALALICLPMFIFGFAGLAQRLGWQRPITQLAFITQALSIVAVMFAAIADGLMTLALLSQALIARDTLGQAIQRSAEFNVTMQLNQACAQVDVIGTSIAMLLWSAGLWRLDTAARRCAIWGAAVALIGSAGLLSGHLAMSAHGFGLVVLLQATWTIAVALSSWPARAASSTALA